MVPGFRTRSGFRTRQGLRWEMVLIACLAVGVARGAGAATFRVTTDADSGPGSLREAIDDANGNPGPDEILFRIPGSGGGVQTIELLKSLPPLTEQVTIDGSSQGKPDEHLVVIDGWQLSGAVGLVLLGQDSWLHHLVLHRFTTAIGLGGNGYHLVTDCRVGTDASGLVEMGNDTGISVCSANNTIAASLISANYIGIAVHGDDNVIDRNLLGSDRDGLPFAATGSASQVHGVHLSAGSHNRITRNTIGGSKGGILLQSVDGSTTSDNYILDNSVGISSSGGPLGDLHWAVRVTTVASYSYWGPSWAMDNVIGGVGPGEGNRIAHVGRPPGSPWQSGAIDIDNGSGWTPPIGNRVRGNTIFDLTPGAMPIDLGTSGPDPNDWGDVDYGSNNSQNAPVILDAREDPLLQGVEISGELSTSITLRVDYAIDFFATTAATSPGVCEARRYLGTRRIRGDGSGLTSFAFALPGTVDPGAEVSATATVETPGQPADTSELSPCVPVR